MPLAVTIRVDSDRRSRSRRRSACGGVSSNSAADEDSSLVEVAVALLHALVRLRRDTALAGGTVGAWGVDAELATEIGRLRPTTVRPSR